MTFYLLQKLIILTDYLVLDFLILNNRGVVSDEFQFVNFQEEAAVLPTTGTLHTLCPEPSLSD